MYVNVHHYIAYMLCQRPKLNRQPLITLQTNNETAQLHPKIKTDGCNGCNAIKRDTLEHTKEECKDVK